MAQLKTTSPVSSDHFCMYMYVVCMCWKLIYVCVDSWFREREISLSRCDACVIMGKIKVNGCDGAFYFSG